MNYKEKYENVINRLQGLITNGKKQGHIIIRIEDIENAIPELKESEVLSNLEDAAQCYYEDKMMESERVQTDDIPISFKAGAQWMLNQLKQNKVNFHI